MGKVFSSSTAPPTAEEAGGEYGRALWQVTGKSVLLRSGPGLDSPPLCRLPAGVQLVVDRGVTLDDDDRTVRFHVLALNDEQGRPLSRDVTFNPPLAADLSTMGGAWMTPFVKSGPWVLVRKVWSKASPDEPANDVEHTPAPSPTQLEDAEVRDGSEDSDEDGTDWVAEATSLGWSLDRVHDEIKRKALASTPATPAEPGPDPSPNLCSPAEPEPTAGCYDTDEMALARAAATGTAGCFDHEITWKHGMVQLADGSAELSRSPGAESAPGGPLDAQSLKARADDKYFRIGADRYRAVPMSDIAFDPKCLAMLTGAEQCPGPCRPFWRKVYQVEAKLLCQAYSRGATDVLRERVECKRRTQNIICDFCHCMKCWPTREEVAPFKRGRHAKPVPHPVDPGWGAMSPNAEF